MKLIGHSLLFVGKVMLAIVGAWQVLVMLPRAFSDGLHSVVGVGAALVVVGAILLGVAKARGGA